MDNTNNNENNSMNNSMDNNTNNTLNADNNSMDNDMDKQKKTKSKTGLLRRNNPLSNNVFLIAIFILVIIFILIIVLFSEKFRINRTINNFERYKTFQTIKNYNYNSAGHNILGNHYIASSFNSCNVKRPILSYMNCNDILKGILQSGARFIEFKIFNDKFGISNIEPIVNNGFETGEWKLCFNGVNFEDVCKVIKEHAFKINKKIDNGKIEGVPNPDDPLFISLDLKTRNNVETLNILARYLTTHLINHFLPPKYNYKNDDVDLLHIKMKELKKNIVIFCSDGYQGSDLETLINGTWKTEGNLKRVYYEYLDKMGKDDIEIFKKDVKQKLTIVTPDPDLDLIGRVKIVGKQNYDTKLAFDLGCHFVSVYYQSMNNMSPYITKFRNNSIVLKPDMLHVTKSDRRETTDDGEKEEKEAFNYSDYRKKLQEASDLLEDLEID